jgi:hypothetical protein
MEVWQQYILKVKYFFYILFFLVHHNQIRYKNNHFVLYIISEHNSMSIFFYVLSPLSPLSLSLLSQTITKCGLRNIQVCMLVLYCGDQKNFKCKTKYPSLRGLLDIVIKHENTVVLNFSLSR